MDKYGLNSRRTAIAVLFPFGINRKNVKVIHEGYKGTEDLMTVELGDDPKANKRALDDAILEGLAHRRIFREARTGAIVQFGYDLKEA